MSACLHVVHIFSTSYSGSTWLNLLLGSHSRAMSIGEFKSLEKVNGAVCTVHGRSCNLWPNIATDDPSRNVYDQLHERTGCDTFIVNNSRNFLHAQRAGHIRQSFLHLIRDGRAVVASQLRKFESLSAWRAAWRWRHRVRRNLRFLRRQKPHRVTRVAYEALKDQTESEIRRLCDFLEIDFQPAMLEYWKHEHHFLGGNRATLFHMLRTEGRSLPQGMMQPSHAGPADWDLDHYRNQHPGRFRDERWREELQPIQRRAFRLTAGLLNRRLGYRRGDD